MAEIENKSENSSTEENSTEENKAYPILPLRNTVLFPHQVIPVYIGRDQSLNLIEDLPTNGKKTICDATQQMIEKATADGV